MMEKYCSWHVQTSNVHVVLSESLMKRFKLWQDVLSTWDNYKSNYSPLQHDTTQQSDDYHIILIPPSHYKRRLPIKDANKNMSMEDFMKRFNRFFEGIATINFEPGHDSKRFIMKKLRDDDGFVIILSPSLHQMTAFRQAGLYKEKSAKFLNYNLEKAFKSTWEVDVFYISNFEDMSAAMKIPITLKSQSFKDHNEAISYLNETLKDDNITFSLDKSNALQMKIKEDATSITFSDTLRDIFAFDQNTYGGRGTYSASAVFSLSRRINYLYVYCDVNDYVRIGDTEAPLLAVIPFNPIKCISLLQEKVFKLPMYVPVIKNPISQIDIGIYDGAGQLVPFAADSVTSIRLHFRKV